MLLFTRNIRILFPSRVFNIRKPTQINRSHVNINMKNLCAPSFARHVMIPPNLAPSSILTKPPTLARTFNSSVNDHHKKTDENENDNHNENYEHVQALLGCAWIYVGPLAIVVLANWIRGDSNWTQGDSYRDPYEIKEKMFQGIVILFFIGILLNADMNTLLILLLFLMLSKRH
jgi:hypothetical protein